VPGVVGEEGQPGQVDARVLSRDDLVQLGQHLHGVEEPGPHLTGRGPLGVLAEHGFHALPGDQVHRHERRDVRRLARVAEEHVGGQRPPCLGGRPLDRLLQPRLAQHVTVAFRGETRRRHLEHYRALPRGDAGQVHQEGEAGRAAGQRGHAGDPRAGTPAGHPLPHAVSQPSQQSLVSLTGGHQLPSPPKTDVFYNSVIYS
jgi:hypothetical protein